MISQLVAEANGLGVVMIVVSGLMGESRIKSDAFVVIPIAVPDPVASQAIDGGGVGAAAAGIGKGIAAVEHGDAIDHDPGGPETGQGFGGRNDGIPRDAVGLGGVGGKVGEVLGFGGIEIPRSHDVAGET